MGLDASIAALLPDNDEGEISPADLRAALGHVTASIDDSDDFSAAAAAAYQPKDSDLTALAAANNSSILAATTASFTTSDESKLDGIEAAADVTDAGNVAAAGAVMEGDTSTAGFGFVVDEDAMGSDSATKVPTQQSVKAYVDAHVNDSSAAHAASAVSADPTGLDNTDATDVQGVIADFDAAITAADGGGGGGSDDQTAAEVPFTPAGGLAATNVQTALEELDSEKSGTGHNHDAAYQPLDSDLTALAALTTTSFGRSLLEAANAGALRTLAGTVIGTDVQAFNAKLAALVAATWADNKMAYFTGTSSLSVIDLTAAGRALLDDADASAQLTTLGVSTFVKTLLDDADAATARGTLGLGTGDSPQFTAVNVGHASDTTLARSGAGDLSVEGNALYRAGGTDVPVADGGTGASSASGARTNLGLVIGTDVQAYLAGLTTAVIPFLIDGGGSTITTGVKGDIEVPFACTITRATLLADQSGSIVVDVWKDSYANYPPVVGDSITASAKPTLSSAAKSQDSTLTGWTTSIAAGDTLRFNVDSITTCTRVLVSLRVTKT